MQHHSISEFLFDKQLFQIFISFCKGKQIYMEVMYINTNRIIPHEAYS